MIDYDDPDQLIDVTWPYDGPHTTDSVTAAAAALPHLVRYLNNATQRGKHALPYASTAYQVTSQLASAIGLLPQLIEQLQKSLVTQAENPGLYDDRAAEYSAEQTARTAANQLADTSVAISQLTDRLARAASTAGHLGNRD